PSVCCFSERASRGGPALRRQSANGSTQPLAAVDLVRAGLGAVPALVATFFTTGRVATCLGAAGCAAAAIAPSEEEADDGGVVAGAAAGGGVAGAAATGGGAAGAGAGGGVGAGAAAGGALGAGAATGAVTATGADEARVPSDLPMTRPNTRQPTHEAAITTIGICTFR